MREITDPRAVAHRLLLLDVLRLLRVVERIARAHDVFTALRVVPEADPVVDSPLTAEITRIREAVEDTFLEDPTL